MRGLSARARVRSPLPEGTAAVAAGLVVLGLASYGFLVISGRALGPAAFAPLSALWALVFTVGPGVFVPLEQEVARALAARRAVRTGGWPVVRRAAHLAAAAALVLLVAIVAGHRPLLEELLASDVLLLAALALGLAGYAAEHLLRGTLSGTGRFGTYGTVLAVEGLTRLAASAALALVGVRTAGAYGLAFGVAPLIGAAVWLGLPRPLTLPGPGSSWRDLSTAFGWLLAAQLLAQFLVNSPQIAVVALAKEVEKGEAGRFIAGVILARVPLFLFAAIQAALLPELATLASTGRRAEFTTGLGRLVGAVAALGAVAAAGAYAVGPPVLRLLFGARYDLGRRDLGLLAVASGLYMVALALAQALIALGAHARVVAAWAVGVVSFLATTALLAPLYLRVEVGFVAGAAVAVVAMGLLLARRMRVADWSAGAAEPPPPTVSVEP